MVAVPAATPATIPVAEPTVAVVGWLLLHVPAVVVVESVIADPSQTVLSPVIAAGVGWTVTTVVAIHEVGMV